MKSPYEFTLSEILAICLTDAEFQKSQAMNACGILLRELRAYETRLQATIVRIEREKVIHRHDEIKPSQDQIELDNCTVVML